MVSQSVVLQLRHMPVYKETPTVPEKYNMFAQSRCLPIKCGSLVGLFWDVASRKISQFLWFEVWCNNSDKLIHVSHLPEVTAEVKWHSKLMIFFLHESYSFHKHEICHAAGKVTDNAFNCQQCPANNFPQNKAQSSLILSLFKISYFTEVWMLCLQLSKEV